MLKNVQEAKFDKVLRADLEGRARRRRPAANVSFDAFFTHILMHELMHGLGPAQHHASAAATTTVRQELKETYSAIEEAKADISGLFALQYLIDKGVARQGRSSRRCTRRSWPRRSARSASASTRRTARGMAMQLNYLLDAGRVRGRRRRHLRRRRRRRSRAAVTALTREIMTLQAEGNYAEGEGAARHGWAWSAPRCSGCSTG